MRSHDRFIPCVLVTLMALAAALLGQTVTRDADETQRAGVAELQRAFEHPPDDAKIMMRWWWFGPAVTQPQLEREMRRMKEGGIGGFEVQPVYPVALDDTATGIRNIPF